MTRPKETVPLDLLEIGEAYHLHARNIGIGVWDGKDFWGVRRKFGDTFIDSETHWDLDEHHGTAVALRKCI